MTRRRSSGMTILETTFVAAIAAIIILALVRFVSRTMPVFRRLSVRQQVLLDSRTCIDSIVQMLNAGTAKSLAISTPSGTAVVPNSRVDFALETPLTSGTTAYAIYLDNNTVYRQDFALNGPREPRPLATHVSGLMFTGDSRDPAIVTVTLRMDAPWDASGDPTHVTTLLVPNQVAHLVENK